MKSITYPVSLALNATGATQAFPLDYTTRYSVIVSIAHTTEVQTITLSNVPTAGTYKLTYDGNESGALNYNDNAATVQTAIRLLAGLASVTVSGSYTAGFAITMTGATASGALASIPAITVTSSGTVEIAAVTEQQLIDFDNDPNVGSYTITYAGNTTGALQHGDNAATVQTALRLLAGLGSVTVAGTPDTTGFTVTMTGVAGNAALMTSTTTTLGITELQTLTFPSVAASTGGDYFVVTDAAGLTWAAALNKSGSDPAPTGAIYTAIPAGRKVNVNISGGTDAASVAALVETAIDALTGFTAAIVTDDSAANGTMTFTTTARGNVAAPQFKNADDSGAGSITGVTTTNGANTTITISETVQGVAQSSTVFTVTETTSGSEAPSGVLTVEASNDAYPDDKCQIDQSTGVFTENTSATWATVAGSSQTITADGTYAYNTSDAAYRAYRLKWTRTEGNGTLTGTACVKGT